MTLQLTIEPWEDASNDAPEICRTSGPLTIEIDGKPLTRNLDDWSQSVKRSTRVSAYPLAAWLASSWWRLRYEPLPVGNRANSSWRMAHEVAASGYGYLWPQLVFSCDGERMHYWSIPTDANDGQPVHYLTGARGSISTKEFEQAVDSFIQLVIDRLDAVQLPTELKGLWQEVLEERADADLAHYRKLEALLGYDPDEIDAAVVERFIQLGTTIGRSVIDEVASVCASADPLHALHNIDAIAQGRGIEGRFALTQQQLGTIPSDPLRPWERGRTLAHAARRTIGLNAHAIDDRALSELAELADASVFNGPFDSARLSIGLAVRDEDNKAKIILRKHNRAGRRFEFARLLGDHLLSSQQDHWLPAADTKTIRQKWQRAFAAEFLCPIEALLARLDDDLSDDAIEEAADHFGVSERTAQSQLVNHGYLPVCALGDNPNTGAYPYRI